MMTPTEMVERAVESAQQRDVDGAEFWLVEARRYISFARIHELVNKMLRRLRNVKWVFYLIDPALIKPLDLSPRTA